ncbi:DUF4188 domain-containing protein [uncultured Methylobacterium sp.]|jgi:hypothetical protein|uniref:monooxygenase family protein n=1 Tax=uncultured Methylobacterium sp. TaxID=157278 RepID=UPI002633CC9C|nr:DUF4188 domain-containing protein [uncultured Methylobacterium sp.]
MQPAALRETVDLSGHPDLVVILLGLKLRRVRALRALPDLGRGLSAIRRDPPDGLLFDQRFLFGWNHIGIRQYWRDLDSLERFTREAPHGVWWKSFLKDPQGCGFWHETFSARGGFEAIYVEMPDRQGLAAFAPVRRPVGPFLSSRGRLRDDADRRVR